jgi:DNA repair protein RadC
MDTRRTNRALARLLDPTPHAVRRARALITAAGDVARLASCSDAWLVSAGGLTPLEARRVSAAFLLGISALRSPPPPALRRAEDVVGSVLQLAACGVEELWLISVDPGLRVTGHRRVAQGGRASCAIDPVDVLRAAIEDGASGMFIVHNHPSGDPTPSDADLRFTRRIQQQAEVLGLAFHDHLVLAGARWASCASGAVGTLSTPADGEPPAAALPTQDQACCGGVAERVSASRGAGR